MQPSTPPAPRFPAVLRPTSDFQAARDGRSTGPLYLDINLSTARSAAAGTALELNIAGNFVYFDQRPQSGLATLYIETDDRGSTPLSVFAGWKANVAFTRIFIENPAQPGLSLRLVYGTDLDLNPGQGAGVSVLNPVNTVDIVDQAVTTNYNSFNPGLGTVNTTILAPATNINGVRVRSAYMGLQAGVGGTINGLVYAAAAATFNFAANTNGVIGFLFRVQNQAVLTEAAAPDLRRQIPPGWGLFLATATSVAPGAAIICTSFEVLP
jgi:hypothetical protein